MATVRQFLASRAKNLDKSQFAYQPEGGIAPFALDTLIPSQIKFDQSKMMLSLPFADGQRRDGVGDLLEVGGIDFSRHITNPCVLFDHGKSLNLPIAMACAWDADAGRYDLSKYGCYSDTVTKRAWADATFYQGRGMKGVEGQREFDHAVLCEQYYHMAVTGLVRGGSIGYQVKHATHLPADYERGTPQGLHLHSVLMLEASLVVMPANQDTVMKVLGTPRMCGKPLSPYLIKSLAPYAPPRKAQMGWEGKRIGGTGPPTPPKKPKQFCHNCGSENAPGSSACGTCNTNPSAPTPAISDEGTEMPERPAGGLNPSNNSLPTSGKAVPAASAAEQTACVSQGKPAGTTALGYGCGDAPRDKSVPVPHGDHSKTDVPPARWRPGQGATCKTLKGLRERYGKSIGSKTPPVGDLIRLAKEAMKKKTEDENGSPDYGYLHLKPATGEVWYTTWDGDSREFTRWLFAELEKLVGKGKVKMEAESSPKEEDGWTKLYPDRKSNKSKSLDSKQMEPRQDQGTGRWHAHDPKTGKEHGPFDSLQQANRHARGMNKITRKKPKGNPPATKSLRLKYRKGHRRRTRLGRSETSLVHVHSSEMRDAESFARGRGVTWFRVCQMGNHEKVRLTGDGAAITEVARRFGRKLQRKTLEDYGVKGSWLAECPRDELGKCRRRGEPDLSGKKKPAGPRPPARTKPKAKPRTPSSYTIVPDTDKGGFVAKDGQGNRIIHGDTYAQVRLALARRRARKK